MFRKILIANRGEIALRVIRACREMGIPSIAIHPGYGFLSENTSFAEICSDVQITFIGPPASVMSLMGDKVDARTTMAELGLPILPGTPVLRTLSEGLDAAREIGFPLMLKAAAGGGGRGIRLVKRPDEFERVFTVAQMEVREAFRDDGLYLERYLERTRHLEIQVLVDNFGHGVHLGERNCSCQRRNQKVLEESPSPALPPELRQEIGMKALRAVQAIGYRNAGTLELLLDEDNRYYFMEMNTRLQVEHPVTELVTSTDLVKEQIRIAAGLPLHLQQEDIRFHGHAIECRITAEDAESDFRPQTGTIERYLPPGGPGVRVDSHLYAGYHVPPHYDSLLAKLIVWAETREAAIARMLRALDEYVIEGIVTTIPFHKRLLKHEGFIRGETYTRFIQEEAVALGL